MLQLHKTEEGQPEYAEFLHLPKRKFTDFGMLNPYALVIRISLSVAHEL